MEQTRNTRLGQKCITILLTCLFLNSCKTDKTPQIIPKDLAETIKKPTIEFGFNLNDYIVKRDTIKSGETFGVILDRHHVPSTKIYDIVNAVKDTFDTRYIRAGKPYTILCSKDSLQTPKSFIYQPNKVEYVVINFEDTLIRAYKSRKPIKYIEREVSGIIENNISETLDEQGKNVLLAYKLSDIYAWTVNFFRLQKGDKFKIIYTEKYIDDTIYAGIDQIKASYFEHNEKSFYAFNFETDSIKGVSDYYDETAKSLRRAFLKAPVEYKRISSRYNLRRRIALYGNRIRPHKGTDFAADIGTPIKATGNGKIIKSTYSRGNGNYVKIQHNQVYDTQYLHMKRRNVKVGQYVKQGDVIGWVGMTGNTSGPHVCYRFWKNGKQVDPFKEDLPAAEPIKDHLKANYLEFIKPLKAQLDNMSFPKHEDSEEPASNLITMVD